MESTHPGRVLHGVAENAIPFTSIAEKIGERVGVPATSVTPDQASERFPDPFMARVFATDAPASSSDTQSLLGWAPTHATLIEDLDTGDYFTPNS